jgi:L-fuconolactonase
MGAGFIDSHVHFWDTSRIPCAWLRGFPAISAPHGPSELANESAPEAPSRIVFVQAECDRAAALDEVRWAESLAGARVPTAGIVAFAPMDGGLATEAALQGLARMPLVRGRTRRTRASAFPTPSSPAFAAAANSGSRSTYASGIPSWRPRPSWRAAARRHRSSLTTGPSPT